MKQPVNKELESEIQREIKAQIGVLQAFKTPITHLDGHQHIHVAPGVFPVALAEASNHAIPWIRVPDEPGPSILSLMDRTDRQDEITMFSALGAAARSVVVLSEIESCDHFRGLHLKGKLDATLLDELLRGSPHRSYRVDGPSWEACRYRERRSLCGLLYHRKGEGVGNPASILFSLPFWKNTG